MIWARKPTEQEAGDMFGWRPDFAFRPRTLIDGRRAWLEKVESISYFASEIPASAPFHLTMFGSRCFRLPVSTDG